MLTDAAPPAAGGGHELARLRRLVNVTIVATLLLIVIGGIVRVSESGLGCGPPASGTHGWPLCEGRVLPFLETSMLIEFTHRAAAAIVGVLIALIAWRALRRLRTHRWIVRGSLAALVLVLVQAGLGGLTVERNLQAELVAAHLGLAMALLGVLLAIARVARPPDEAPVPAGVSRGLRALAITASALVLATIVAGGLVAGTERMGAHGATTTQGAHMACGKEFPTCLGKLMPYGVSRLTDIHLTHRAFMYLAAFAVLAVFVAARRRGVRSWPFTAALALLVVQIALGALNVWLGEHAALIVAHLIVGTLLWGAVIQATLSLAPVPSARAERLRHVSESADAPATARA